MPEQRPSDDLENPYAAPKSGWSGTPSSAAGLRATGYLIVAVSFVVVALLADAVIRFVGYHSRDLALALAAITACQIGTLLWSRQSPDSSERSVKLGLGIALAVTAVSFALAFQAISGWLTHPEIVLPITAVGCFGAPFVLVGPLWRSLAKSKAVQSEDG